MRLTSVLFQLSSAHVYLRLAPGQTLDSVSDRLDHVEIFSDHVVFQLPKEVINDCAQLVKANSIQGSKMNEVDIVYTMWANLNKTADMEVGQIGFHSNKAVKKIRQLSKDNAIVNRLNKTKEEKEVDFKAEREGRDRREREEKKKVFRKEEEARKAEEKSRKAEAELRSYDRLMNEDNMSSNKDGGNDSDDFM